jgi:hypothetical protein
VNLVETAGRLGDSHEGRGRQQDDAVRRVLAPDSLKRPQRLDEISKSAKFND